MSLRSRIRGGQDYLAIKVATAAQFLTLRLVQIGSTHVGCDDSGGPGHAPRYLDVRHAIMSITTHLLIPVKVDGFGQKLQSIIAKTGLIQPYSVEIKKVQKRITSYLMFSKDIEVDQKLESGTKYDDIANCVDQSIINGYGNIGGLSDSKFKELVNLFGGTTGDGINGSNWYPWDVDIEVNVGAGWGDDEVEIPGVFLAMGGYGNPALGVDEFFGTIKRCGFIDEIVRSCGMPYEGAIKECIKDWDGNSVMARLSV